MKKTILIKGQPFYYEAEELVFAGGPEITFEQAQEVLFRAKEILDRLGIRFWLIYGTLLGAVRENSFISHDFDVDIQTDMIEETIAAIPVFDAAGMKLIRVDPGRILTFRIEEGAYIDIYFKRRAPFPLNLWCTWLNGNIVPKKLFRGLTEMQFLGRTFMVPQAPERLLEFFYGKSWHTPIKGVHGRYDIYPVYAYRKLKKEISNIFKKHG